MNVYRHENKKNTIIVFDAYDCDSIQLLSVLLPLLVLDLPLWFMFFVHN